MNFNLDKNSPLDVTNKNGDTLVDEEEDEFGELRYDGGVLVQDRQFMASASHFLNLVLCFLSSATATL